jgi:hypothetical protein
VILIEIWASQKFKAPGNPRDGYVQIRIFEMPMKKGRVSPAFFGSSYITWQLRQPSLLSLLSLLSLQPLPSWLALQQEQQQERQQQQEQQQEQQRQQRKRRKQPGRIQQRSEWTTVSFETPFSS